MFDPVAFIYLNPELGISSIEDASLYSSNVSSGLHSNLDAIPQTFNDTVFVFENRDQINISGLNRLIKDAKILEGESAQNVEISSEYHDTIGRPIYNFSNNAFTFQKPGDPLTFSITTSNLQVNDSVRIVRNNKDYIFATVSSIIDASTFTLSNSIYKFNDTSSTYNLLGIKLYDISRLARIEYLRLSGLSNIITSSFHTSNFNYELYTTLYPDTRLMDPEVAYADYKNYTGDRIGNVGDLLSIIPTNLASNPPLSLSNKAIIDELTINKRLILDFDSNGGGRLSMNGIDVYYITDDAIRKASDISTFFNGLITERAVKTYIDAPYIGTSVLCNLQVTGNASFLGSTFINTAVFSNLQVTNNLLSSNIFASNNYTSNNVMFNGTASNFTTLSNTTSNQFTLNANIENLYTSNATTNIQSTSNLFAKTATILDSAMSNTTISNLLAIETTFSNVNANTICVANLNGSNLNADSMYSSNAYLSNATVINMNSSNAYILDLVSSNGVITNLQSSNINVSILSVSSNIQTPQINASNIFGSNLFVQTAQVSNISAVNASLSNLMLSNGEIINLITSNTYTSNLFVVNNRSSNLITPIATISNVFASNIYVASNFASNLFTSNLLASNIITPSIVASNVTISNARVINSFSSNTATSNLTASNGYIQTLSFGTLNAPFVTTFSNISAMSIVSQSNTSRWLSASNAKIQSLTVDNLTSLSFGYSNITTLDAQRISATAYGVNGSPSNVLPSNSTPPNFIFNNIQVNSTLGVNGVTMIGTNSSLNSVQLRVKGLIEATNYNTTSDSRLKRDINQIDAYNALESICSLNPVSFAYKHRPLTDPKNEYRYGFIAQEVEAVLPAVTFENEHYSVFVHKELRVVPLTNNTNNNLRGIYLSNHCLCVGDRISIRCKYTQCFRPDQNIEVVVTSIVNKSIFTIDILNNQQLFITECNSIRYFLEEVLYDSIKNIDAMQLIPLLVASVQELKKTLDELKDI